MKQTPLELAKRAKSASRRLFLFSTEEKNTALQLIAKSLQTNRAAILEANRKDLEAAAGNLSSAMLDRLSLQDRLEGIISDVKKVALLPDPIGELIENKHLENGLLLQKRRVPLGVLGIIYEARPNVTVDTAVLALKTGNCAILRGGKEALRTNRALMEAIQVGLDLAGFPKDALQLIQTTSRIHVKQLMQLDTYIDMIIPRGGENLQQFCRKHSTIPVIYGGIGICHLYVDETADLKKAAQVIMNAKTQRPTVCNAVNTILVHHQIASSFLPLLTNMLQEKGVSFRLDPKSWEILRPQESAIFKKAELADWHTDWLSLVLGIKVVDSLQEGIEHIQTHSSGHSDGILTNTPSHAQLFVQAIDSAAVYINASTRFTDGGEFELGAEIAISTQKLHARGPVALKELTTYKWIVEGNYHIRGRS